MDANIMSLITSNELGFWMGRGELCDLTLTSNHKLASCGNSDIRDTDKPKNK